MIAKVELFRDPGEGSRITRLPAWIAPKVGGRYWHQPRSASLHGERLVVRFWCGQTIGNLKVTRLTAVPPEDLMCGTCIGRRAGYDREGGAVFRPRDHWKLPTRCPGNGWDRPDFKLCNACGDRVRAAQGWNAWGSANHRPGPGIAERLRPCPNHGWRDIGQAADERFVCRSWRCGWAA